MSYETLKALHLLGVILFLGNIVVTGWWKVMADRTGDSKTIAFAQRQVTLTDFVFTAGGAALLLAAALGMIAHLGWETMSEPWVTWGLGLFAASGVIWVAILIPVQIIQARLARGFATGGDIPARYWRLGQVWILFGVIATILPFANLYWMVFKG